MKLDCSKLKAAMGWQPKWHIEEAVAKTVEWAKAWQNNDNISLLMEKQIREFLED